VGKRAEKKKKKRKKKGLLLAYWLSICEYMSQAGFVASQGVFVPSPSDGAQKHGII
jgi:hypothetical protein